MTNHHPTLRTSYSHFYILKEHWDTKSYTPKLFTDFHLDQFVPDTNFHKTLKNKLNFIYKSKKQKEERMAPLPTVDTNNPKKVVIDALIPLD